MQLRKVPQNTAQFSQTFSIVWELLKEKVRRPCDDGPGNAASPTPLLAEQDTLKSQR
jgi:hypothetical protein